ncbi:cell wall protein Ecm33 [Aspergillus melleus]|uniref:cell wall protein Ecm33 n=1 Tax=Aspergillus melleus TaxID=138277 RepID=UPI001E8CDC5D|nr:cell wall protein Ecm33 [Aspergillus melleus]KAH8432913.1 cell wall protein Ecm33 [Aspergillus melleus]
MKYISLMLSMAGMSLAACGSLTLTSQLDVDTQVSCSTINGDVKISSEFIGSLSLSGVKKINGNLNGTNLYHASSLSFPDLEQVGGALRLTGGFNEISMPSLDMVKGGFRLASTQNLPCEPWNVLQENHRIHGRYTCQPYATPDIA